MVTMRSRGGSLLFSGLVGLLVSAAYLAAWYELVERPSCDETGIFACAGPSIVMILVGCPAAYVAMSLGLRAARAPMPWLAPVAVVGGLVVLVRLSEFVEPPLWWWPVPVALLCVLWTWLVAKEWRFGERQ